MRLAVALAVAGCSHPAPASPPVLAGRLAQVGCDEGRWRELARSPLRVRVADRDLIVIEKRDGDTRVIERLRGALVAGTVPDRALGRVVTRETQLWDGPGGSPMPGVVVEPGVPVTGTGSWPTVDTHLAIQATGYVPPEATGLVWEAQPPPGTGGKVLGRTADVLVEPRADAERVASIPGQEPVFDQLEPGPAGWLHVAASDSAVHVTGWVAPPPPPSPPSRMQHSYDFSDDTVEGDLVRPEAPPRVDLATGCIRARQDDSGDVLGVVIGDLPGVRVGDGWLRVELSPPWGRVTGYARVR